MTDTIELRCARIFRIAADLKNSPEHAALTDAELLVAPLDIFEIDSLTSLEFIMEIENELDVELDEEAVNRCSTVADIAGLVSAALRA